MLKGSSGQIVVEYLLLLVIGVAVAVVLTTTLVSREQNRPGILIQKWSQLIQVVGSDSADDIEEDT